jgi:glycosyltransferase involved in cell wall biosynthesis
MKPKVLAIPADDKAVGKLRIISPFGELKKQGLIAPESELLMLTTQNSKDLAALGAKMAEFDIVWFQIRLSHLFLWELVNARGMNPKIKLIVELDDNIFDVQPWNPCVDAFAIDPILYGDTLVRPRMDVNLSRRRLAETILAESDAVVVTTSILAERMSRYNKNIFVNPNTLDWSLWDQSHVGRRPLEHVYIGWQGGNTHLMDWAECDPAIKYVLRNNVRAKLELFTVQDVMTPFTKNMPESKLILHEFISYDAHPYRSQVLRPDIGICPLHKDEFNICKSDLKFTEYAACKVPVIASNIPPYSESIIHGETGFLVDSTQDWIKYLNRLIEDPLLRAKIGGAAYEWAKKNRRLDLAAAEWAQTLTDTASLPTWFIPE